MAYTTPYRPIPITNLPYPWVQNLLIQTFIIMVFIIVIGLTYALGTWPFNLSEDA